MPSLQSFEDMLFQSPTCPNRTVCHIHHALGVGTQIIEVSCVGGGQVLSFKRRGKDGVKAPMAAGAHKSALPVFIIFPLH